MGGRRLTVEPVAAYKALNYMIQGSAAVLLKRTLVEMACAGLEDYLVVPVHDEVVFSVPVRCRIEDVRTVVPTSCRSATCRWRSVRSRRCRWSAGAACRRPGSSSAPRVQWG